MRRVLIFVVLATAVVAAAFVIARPDPAPELHFDASVPDDLRAVAVEAWDGFLAAHPARVDCIGPINMSAAWELDNRAEYRPATATLVIRVPGTAPNLTNDLTHEFAHHVEFTCPEHEELRPAFLAAQGFPASADWFSGATVGDNAIRAVCRSHLGGGSRSGVVTTMASSFPTRRPPSFADGPLNPESDTPGSIPS